MYLSRLDRKGLNLPVGISHTALGQRTVSTIGISGHTLHRAEIHYGLIVVSLIFIRQEFLSQRLEILFPFNGINRIRNTEVTGQHPINIAVHHGTMPAKGKGSYRCSRIVPHSFQRSYVFILIRKCATVNNLTGCGMQVSGT